MKTTYILKISNKKYLERLLNYNVRFTKIKYQGDICFLYVNYDDYNRLIKYKDLYGISLYKITGFTYYQEIIKKNYIFISSVIIGIVFLYLLSNIIFDVKIMSNNQDLIKIISGELEEANIKKYRFIKSFKEKETVKNKILSNYKDKIEWLEIDRIGTKYYVRVLERIIHKENSDVNYQNIVARKNAIIKEIRASSGEIVKKINDYVSKGDVIISGSIMKKDEVKDIVEAKGIVYGETWYDVKVILPRTYVTSIYTGNSYNSLSINIFNKRLLLNKKKYDIVEYQDKVIINNKILPFSINKTKVLEKKIDTYFYTYQEALEKGLILARDKLLNDLKGDSQILLQKKLKLYEENSTIVVEVFFKVYEDITDYEKITGKEGEQWKQSLVH